MLTETTPSRLPDYFTAHSQKAAKQQNRYRHYGKLGSTAIPTKRKRYTLEFNSIPDPVSTPNNLDREHVLRKFSDVGWHVNGKFYYTPTKGVGLSYPVEYQALIDPWGATREEQVVNFSIDIPNQLAEELLTPVRDAARQVIHGDLSKAELAG